MQRCNSVSFNSQDLVNNDFKLGKSWGRSWKNRWLLVVNWLEGFSIRVKGVVGFLGMYFTKTGGERE